MEWRAQPSLSEDVSLVQLLAWAAGRSDLTMRFGTRPALGFDRALQVELNLSFLKSLYSSQAHTFYLATEFID